MHSARTPRRVTRPASSPPPRGPPGDMWRQRQSKTSLPVTRPSRAPGHEKSTRSSTRTPDDCSGAGRTVRPTRPTRSPGQRAPVPAAPARPPMGASSSATTAPDRGRRGRRVPIGGRRRPAEEASRTTSGVPDARCPVRHRACSPSRRGPASHAKTHVRQPIRTLPPRAPRPFDAPCPIRASTGLSRSVFSTTPNRRNGEHRRRARTHGEAPGVLTRRVESSVTRRSRPGRANHECSRLHGRCASGGRPRTTAGGRPTCSGRLAMSAAGSPTQGRRGREHGHRLGRRDRAPRREAQRQRKPNST